MDVPSNPQGARALQDRPGVQAALRRGEVALAAVRQHGREAVSLASRIAFIYDALQDRFPHLNFKLPPAVTDTLSAKAIPPHPNS